MITLVCICLTPLIICWLVAVCKSPVICAWFKSTFLVNCALNGIKPLLIICAVFASVTVAFPAVVVTSHTPFPVAAILPTAVGKFCTAFITIGLAVCANLKPAYAAVPVAIAPLATRLPISSWFANAPCAFPTAKLPPVENALFTFCESDIPPLL